MSPTPLLADSTCTCGGLHQTGILTLEQRQYITVASALALPPPPDSPQQAVCKAGSRKRWDSNSKKEKQPHEAEAEGRGRRLSQLLPVRAAASLLLGILARGILRNWGGGGST
ncbi:hypothetical protein KIL84_017180 [Mauremys mutica]|uniref:Uncharacterized protein n=1 Tax=Mauremys mutica TaxID=74926 RepID=A0A9D4AYD7_9SAUR|nr:hypothetical protein KIL84_017180 [Mauremys mutica]